MTIALLLAWLLFWFIIAIIYSCCIKMLQDHKDLHKESEDDDTNLDLPKTL
jgi:hypothetical protein